ncbi:unnamed protein product [Amoebophrya sp. A120]|nr:unnamed protein product [Amoebophrya sp. A120]|eukprot:GSA120T00023434001.1
MKMGAEVIHLGFEKNEIKLTNHNNGGTAPLNPATQEHHVHVSNGALRVATASAASRSNCNVKSRRRTLYCGGPGRDNSTSGSSCSTSTSRRRFLARNRSSFVQLATSRTSSFFLSTALFLEVATGTKLLLSAARPGGSSSGAPRGAAASASSSSTTTASTSSSSSAAARGPSATVTAAAAAAASSGTKTCFACKACDVDAELVEGEDEYSGLVCNEGHAICTDCIAHGWCTLAKADELCATHVVDAQAITAPAVIVGGLQGSGSTTLDDGMVVPPPPPPPVVGERHRRSSGRTSSQTRHASETTDISEKSKILVNAGTTTSKKSKPQLFGSILCPCGHGSKGKTFDQLCRFQISPAFLENAGVAGRQVGTVLQKFVDGRESVEKEKENKKKQLEAKCVTDRIRDTFEEQLVGLTEARCPRCLQVRDSLPQACASLTCTNIHCMNKFCALCDWKGTTDPRVEHVSAHVCAKHQRESDSEGLGNHFSPDELTEAHRQTVALRARLFFHDLEDKVRKMLEEEVDKEREKRAERRAERARQLAERRRLAQLAAEAAAAANIKAIQEAGPARSSTVGSEKSQILAWSKSAAKLRRVKLPQEEDRGHNLQHLPSRSGGGPRGSGSYNNHTSSNASPKNSTAARAAADLPYNPSKKHQVSNTALRPFRSSKGSRAGQRGGTTAEMSGEQDLEDNFPSSQESGSQQQGGSSSNSRKSRRLTGKTSSTTSGLMSCCDEGVRSLLFGTSCGTSKGSGTASNCEDETGTDGTGSSTGRRKRTLSSSSTGSTCSATASSGDCFLISDPTQEELVEEQECIDEPDADQLVDYVHKHLRNVYVQKLQYPEEGTAELTEIDRRKLQSFDEPMAMKAEDMIVQWPERIKSYLVEVMQLPERLDQDIGLGVIAEMFGFRDREARFRKELDRIYNMPTKTNKQKKEKNQRIDWLIEAAQYGGESDEEEEYNRQLQQEREQERRRIGPEQQQERHPPAGQQQPQVIPARPRDAQGRIITTGQGEHPHQPGVDQQPHSSTTSSTISGSTTASPGTANNPDAHQHDPDASLWHEFWPESAEDGEQGDVEINIMPPPAPLSDHHLSTAGGDHDFSVGQQEDEDATQPMDSQHVEDFIADLQDEQRRRDEATTHREDVAAVTRAAPFLLRSRGNNVDTTVLRDLDGDVRMEEAEDEDIMSPFALPPAAGTASSEESVLGDQRPRRGELDIEPTAFAQHHPDVPSSPSRSRSSSPVKEYQSQQGTSSASSSSSSGSASSTPKNQRSRSHSPQPKAKAIPRNARGHRSLAQVEVSV